MIISNRTVSHCRHAENENIRYIQAYILKTA